MKLSVVVVYSGNQYNLFLQAIESLSVAQKNESSIQFENIVILNTKLQTEDSVLGVLNNLNLINAKKKLTSAEARNLGMSYASGDWVYFLDDDAFIETDFFTQFINIQNKNDYACIGGPNLTPSESSYTQNISGFILCSAWGSGEFAKRYKKTYDVNNCSDDKLILCNLFFNKNVFEKYRFQQDLICAEENLLLHKLHKCNFNFKFSSRLYVYHHRRASVIAFLKQIFKYGYGRGEIIVEGSKIYLSNLVPVLFYCVLIFSFFLSRDIFNLVGVSYIILNAVFSLSNGFKYLIPMFVTFPFVHFFYAIGILSGVGRRGIKKIATMSFEKYFFSQK